MDFGNLSFIIWPVFFQTDNSLQHSAQTYKIPDFVNGENEVFLTIEVPKELLKKLKNIKLLIDIINIRLNIVE